MASRSVALAFVIAACGRPYEPLVEAEIAALGVGAEIELVAEQLEAAPEDQRLRAITASADGFAAVWNDNRESYAAGSLPARAFMGRVAPDGSVRDSTGIALPLLPVGDAAIACDGAGTCLVVAVDSVASALVGVRVAGDQVIDATPLVIASAGAVTAASVAWDGSQFRLLWSDGTVNTQTMAATGTLGPVVALGTGDVGGIACSGPRCLATIRQGTVSLRGRLVDPSGPVGADFLIFQGAGRQLGFAPVWDGVRYWVAIVDGKDPPQFVNRNAPVLALRIAADGNVTDPAGIEVSPGSPTFEVVLPRIGHDGTNAIVLWSGLELNPTFHSELRAARVSAAGTVVEPGGVRLAVAHSPSITTGAIACAAQCLVAWDRVGNSDLAVQGTRLQGLTEVDPAGILISTARPGQAAAAIAFGSGQYLAVWSSTRQSSTDPRVAPLRGAMFSPTAIPVPIEIGVPAPTTPNQPCPEQTRAAVAASASSYFVAWREACGQSLDDNIFGEVLDPSGQPIAPAFLVGRSDELGNLPAIVTAASDGATFLVVWEDDGPIPHVVAAVYAAGGALLVPQFDVTANGRFPSAGFDGTSYVVAYQRAGSGTNLDVHATRISPAGTVLGELEIARGTAREDAQVVACGGGECLIAWRGGPQVRARRLLPGGTLLDPGGIVLGTASGTARQTHATFDGQAFEVVWRSAELRTARVAVDGTVLESNLPLATPPLLDRPSLGSDGNGHVVLLYDRYDPDRAFQARRVRARMTASIPLPPDAGVDALLPPDAPPDAAPDAGVDAGVPDAAPDAAVDAGVADAAPDAAPDAVDAAVDAGVADAASPSADAPVAMPDPPDGGCGGCASGRGDVGWLAWLVMGAWFLCARRRARHLKR